MMLGEGGGREEGGLERGGGGKEGGGGGGGGGGGARTHTLTHKHTCAHTHTCVYISEILRHSRTIIIIYLVFQRSIRVDMELVILYTLLYMRGRLRCPPTLSILYFLVHIFEIQIFSTGNYDNPDCNIT